MSFGIAYNPCRNCKEKDKCSFCELTYYRNGQIVRSDDAVEVVHGSFAWIADDSVMCNICGKVFDSNDNADAGLWEFCPGCGAKMDGERREE